MTRVLASNYMRCAPVDPVDQTEMHEREHKARTTPGAFGTVQPQSGNSRPPGRRGRGDTDPKWPASRHGFGIHLPASTGHSGGRPTAARYLEDTARRQRPTAG
jgi:hypothetical protein